MLQHAPLRRAAAPLFSILQTAASRAWARTSTASSARVQIHGRSFGCAGARGAHASALGESSGSTLVEGAKSSPGLSTRLASMQSARALVPTVVVTDLPAPEFAQRIEDRARADPEIVALTTEACEENEDDTVKAAPTEIPSDELPPPSLEPLKPPSLSESALTTDSIRKDDPPWLAVASDSEASYSTDRPRSSTHFSLKPSRLAVPNSRHSFRRLLTNLIRPGLLPTPTDLLALHNAYPLYRSNASYNLLLTYALQHGHLGVTRRLFKQMLRDDLRGDMETRKLWVRYMIRTDRWIEAWRAETARGPLALEIWIEFLSKWELDHKALNSLQFGRRREVGKARALRAEAEALCQSQYDADTAEDADPDADAGTVNDSGLRIRIRLRTRIPLPKQPKGLKRERQPTDIERRRLVLAHFPALTPPELARLPARAVFAAVRWLLRTGEPRLAWDMTVRFLQQLPREGEGEIEPKVQRMCMDMVHLHLLPQATAHDAPHSPCEGDASASTSGGSTSVPRPQSQSEHYRATYSLFRLLDLHPALRPTSDTLLYLLRTLKGTSYPGTRALKLVKTFQKRWGPGLVDERVQRRVASLLLKEGKVKLANRVVRATRDADSAPGARRSPPLPERIEDLHCKDQPSRKELFPRIGQENWAQLLVRRRIKWKLKKREREKAGEDTTNTTTQASRDGSHGERT